MFVLSPLFLFNSYQLWCFQIFRKLSDLQAKYWNSWMKTGREIIFQNWLLQNVNFHYLSLVQWWRSHDVDLHYKPIKGCTLHRLKEVESDCLILSRQEQTQPWKTTRAELQVPSFNLHTGVFVFFFLVKRKKLKCRKAKSGSQPMDGCGQGVFEFL